MMNIQKKIYAGCFALYMVFLASPAFAQQTSYMDEVRGLGSVAGQGLACEASKYETFEMIARTIMITKAVSDSMQEQGMYAYNEEKANAYMSKQFDGFYDCPRIARMFNKQEIFKATLYNDGTIKMPNGEVLTPRQPYDVNFVYKKNSNEKAELQAMYDGGKATVSASSIKADGVEGVQGDRKAKATKPRNVNMSGNKINTTTNAVKEDDSVRRISRRRR